MTAQVAYLPIVIMTALGWAMIDWLPSKLDQAADLDGLYSSQ
jgi:hypothetical protein